MRIIQLSDTFNGSWRTTATGCAASPGCLLYKVSADILLFFCFLSLLQDGFSVVLYFQHVLVSIGSNEIAVASFRKYERPVFLDKFTGQYQVGVV